MVWGGAGGFGDVVSPFEPADADGQVAEGCHDARCLEDNKRELLGTCGPEHSHV